MNRIVLGCCVLLLFSTLAVGQQLTLTARVALVSDPKAKSSTDARNIVLWLTPGADPVKPKPAEQLRLVQKNKSFEPHLLVIPVGSVVAFPNRDPFFHNVFSLFEGKRFDLGLYEAGSTRDVHFDKRSLQRRAAASMALMAPTPTASTSPRT